MTDKTKHLLQAGFEQGFISARLTNEDESPFLTDNAIEHAEDWVNNTLADNGLTVEDYIVADSPKTCYKCGKAITWLAPDGRCKDCTAMTPEEVWGSIREGMEAPSTVVKEPKKHSHYFKDVSTLMLIDIYRTCERFKVDDCSGALQHAIKKLLCSGSRGGGKGKVKDIQEARDTLNRWLEMQEEDAKNIPSN